MTKRFKKLSKLIPKMSYSTYDFSLLTEMLEDQIFDQMQAQFDLIQMDMKEFQFSFRKIRRAITHGIFFEFKDPTLMELYTKLLRKHPRVFLALTMPMEKVPLFINRDYLGIFMRWRLLIGK